MLCLVGLQLVYIKQIYIYMCVCVCKTDDLFTPYTSIHCRMDPVCVAILTTGGDDEQGHSHIICLHSRSTSWQLVCISLRSIVTDSVGRLMTLHKRCHTPHQAKDEGYQAAKDYIKSHHFHFVLWQLSSYRCANN